MLRRPLIHALVLLPFCCAVVSHGADDSRIRMEYRLRTGDHLVYRQTLHRERRGITPPERRNYRSVREQEWRSHVLVVGEGDGQILAGFQRNRLAADFLAYEVRGKDRLEEQRARLADSLKQITPYFSDANRFTRTGENLFPFAAVREFPTPVLPSVHELLTLPSQPVAIGDTWVGPGLLGIELQAVGWEEIGADRCLHVDTIKTKDRARLQYWYCPSKGLLARIELDIRFDLIAVAIVRDKFVWELEDIRHKESYTDWLAEPTLQMGALQALEYLEEPPVALETLYRMLDSGNPDVSRKILARAYGQRLAPPSIEQLVSLADSPDARIRTLVVRLLELATTKDARPLVGRALGDQDYFVREAALGWLRERSSQPELFGNGMSDAETIDWEAVRDPVAARSGEAVAPNRTTGRGGQSCSSGRAANEGPAGERTGPREVTGATVRPMESQPFRGLPYVAYIPEDYRGDQPFPLLIYLSGSGGRALEGILSSLDVFRRTGYVVILPDAGNEYWWVERPTAVVAALLDEVLKRYNIDTNRVYMAGFSNGGTGTVYLSALLADRLAAAVPMMGSGLYLPETDGSPIPVNNLSRLPMLFLHGDQDTVIPHENSRLSVEMLRRSRREAPVKLITLNGRGHGILVGQDDGHTLEYLKQHRRDPFPHRFRFRTESLAFGRRYWVEVMEKDEGAAQVDARMEKDNTIKLKTRRVKRLRLLLRRELLRREGPVRVVLNGKELFRGMLKEDCELLDASREFSGDPYRACSTELIFDVPD